MVMNEKIDALILAVVDEIVWFFCGLLCGLLMIKLSVHIKFEFRISKFGLSFRLAPRTVGNLLI